MKMSSQKPRWPVISVITLVAFAAMLTGWLVKEHLRTAVPPAAAGSELAVLSEPAESAAAPAALSQDPPQTITPAATEPTAGGSVGGTWVRRLEGVEESPAWAVKYGEEFWHRAAGAVEATGEPAPSGTELAEGFNLGQVVERVRHAWMADGAGAEPQVRSRTYTATLREDGVVFSPHRPVEGTGVATEPRGAGMEGARGGEVARDEDGGWRMEDGSDRAIAAQLPHEVRPAARAMSQPDPETAVRFATATVTRDGQALFAAGPAARSWVVLGNTAQALLNQEAGLVEYYETRNDGVEVSWVLQQPVAGSGPLVVEAKFEGLDYAGQTDQGHHFKDANGVARVRLGNVEVADTAGQRWEAAMQVEDGRLRVEVPAEILARAAYPLAIDPALEVEFGMDKPVVGAQASSQAKPAVAGTTSGYFVVWEDLRNGSTSDIYGARVTSGGVVSDPNGIAICTATRSQSSPAVAGSASGYLVVWEDYRNGTIPDIYGARVTSAGAVSDPNGINICTAASSQRFPAVAASGSGYLVAWEDWRSGAGSDIYGARVTSAGVVSPLDGTAICNAAADQYTPSVAASGSGYLVVWTDQRNSGATGSDIYGARVTSAGLVSDAAGIPICTAANQQYSPAVAASGSGCLVVWEDYRNGGTADIYGARVTSAGLVSDAGGIPICTVTNDQTVPALAASGTGYLVVWEDHRRTGFPGAGPDIYGARVTSAGVVSDPTGLAIGAAGYDQQNPAVAASGTGYLVVWEDSRIFWRTGSDIYGARVSSSGLVSPADGFVIATSQNAQEYPAIASNGTNYLVVWMDDRNAGTTGWDMYGVRVTSAGTVSDPNGLAICTAAGDQYEPVVASNGSGYLVAWMDDRNDATTGWDIYGTRVSTTGVVLDPSGIAICTAPNAQGEMLAVASCGSDYLVVWADGRVYNTMHIYGARVTSGGTVSGIPICIVAGNQGVPTVAANGSGYLVVWIDDRNVGTTGWDVYGTRVSTAGVVLDPGGIAVCRAASSQSFPAVAANGADYLVVWTDQRNGGLDIYGARFLSGGGMPDGNGFRIGTGAVDIRIPAIASDGTNYVVVWTDSSSGLCRRRISPAGTLLDTTPLAVNGSLQRDFAALAYGGRGQFLLVSGATRTTVERAVGTLIPAGRPQAGPVLAFQSAAFQVSETGRVATITVALTGNNPGVVGVNYATANGTAVSGPDYTSVSGTLLFASGQTKQTFTVPIIDNSFAYPDKTVNLVLSAPTAGATLGLFNRAVLTIKNDDAAGQLRFGAATYSVKKSAGSVALTVTRSGGLASGVTVAYTTGGGTAVAGIHYTTRSSTLSFAAGETSKTFTVPVVNYAPVEGPKTFYVTLYNPAGGGTVGSPGVATVTIKD